MLVLDGQSCVNGLCFTADGAQLLVTRYPHSVDVWTLATGTREQLLTYATWDSGITIILHPNGGVVRTLRNHPPVVFSKSEPNGRTVSGVGDVRQLIIAPGADWAIVDVLDAGAGWLRGYQCGPGQHFGGTLAWQVRWSQADREALIGFLAAGKQFVTRQGRVLLVHDTATGAVQLTVRYPSYYLFRAAIAPDGSRLAVMGYDKLYIWDTARWGKPTRVACPGGRRFTSLAYHPTRPILAAIQSGQTLVKFLDASTGKLLTKFQWKLGEMREVAFSPDGTLAAAGSAGGKIVVWDVDE